MSFPFNLGDYISPVNKLNKNKIAVVGCLHGNEKIGKYVIDTLQQIEFENFDMRCILANGEAMEQDKRYIDTDLNRCFPGKNDGNHEERLAASLVERIKNSDYVIDIHSTVSKTRDFAIITSESPEVMKLASYIPLETVVFMEPVIAKGGSLIDHARCGVSIEFDCRRDRRYVAGVVLECIYNLRNSIPTKVKQEHYSVFGSLEVTGNFVFPNFRETTVNGETFCPVFSGETAFKDILCLKARRVRR